MTSNNRSFHRPLYLSFIQSWGQEDRACFLWLRREMITPSPLVWHKCHKRGPSSSKKSTRISGTPSFTSQHGLCPPILFWELSPNLSSNREGHLESGRLLLMYGANTDATNNYGYTPLHLCALWNRVDFAKMLIEHRANLNLPDVLILLPLFFIP